MGETTIKDVGGTDYKNSIFGLLCKCLKFPLHLEETEIGSDRNTLWIWFVKERRCGTPIRRPIFKEKAWPYMKGMTNECTFICFKLN